MGDEIRVPSSLLGKRDGESESENEDFLLTHAKKKSKGLEVTEGETGATDALSAETALEQSRREK